MDIAALPADERINAVRAFACPACGVKAGIRCKSSSGETHYKGRDYAHQDRLILMWREAYLNQPTAATDSFKQGREFGRREALHAVLSMPDYAQTPSAEQARLVNGTIAAYKGAGDSKS